ncbi:MAG: STT3 domain-containing protein, partial [Candidatus Omnitrophota bacterium]
MPKYNWFHLTLNLPKPLKKLIPFLLFFVVIGINIYVRLFPAYFPQLKQQAKLTVENKVIKDIEKKIDDSYPEFNPLIKTKIILNAFKEKKKNTSGFKKEILEEYKKLKDPYQNEFGQTYMLEVDGYQWMRYTGNIVKTGQPGTSIKNGRPYDDYMLAPTGAEVISSQFFFYLSAFLYRLAVFCSNGFSLASFLFYLPLFYTFLFLSVLYFAVRTFFSDITAFLCVLFVGLNKVVLSRTTCGWFDYDSLILALPVIIVWLISLALKSGYTLKKRLFFTILAAFVQGVYSGVWIGYWWIFSICAAYYVYIILNAYSLDRKAHKEAFTYMLLAVSFFTVSISLCSFIGRTNVFHSVFIFMQDIWHLGTSRQITIWPYTFYTVGELLKMTPQEIMRALGGPGISLFAVVGVLWIYIKEKRRQKKDFIILMIFWLFAMCIAGSKSLRFIAFLSIPLGIFFGAFIEHIFKYIYAKFNKRPKLLIVFLAPVIIFTLWSGNVLISTSLAQTSFTYPFMNDNWSKMLVYIEKNTP